jgi:restriction endonuclease S subunit
MLILNNENFWIRSGTAQPFVKVKATLEKEIAVPPLDEQKLILEKVLHFMQICDQFETARKHRDSVLTTTRKSAIHAISTAQIQEDLHIAWTRIQKNWNIIASTPECIDSLRELVLDVLFKPKEEDLWPTRAFGDLLTISNGDRSKNYPSKEHRVSSGIPFVNAGHLKDGLIDFSDMDYISREKYESLSGGKFKDGDVLFCLRGSLGKSALVRNIGEGTVASSLAIFRVSAQIDSEYLFWFLQSGMAKIQIKKFDNGTAQPNLAAKSVLRFQIPLPNLSEQVAIVSKVKDLMRICNQLEQSMNQKEHIAHNFARSVISFSA